MIHLCVRAKTGRALHFHNVRRFHECRSVVTLCRVVVYNNTCCIKDIKQTVQLYMSSEETIRVPSELTERVPDDIFNLLMWGTIDYNHAAATLPKFKNVKRLIYWFCTYLHERRASLVVNVCVVCLSDARQRGHTFIKQDFYASHY